MYGYGVYLYKVGVERAGCQVTRAATGTPSPDRTRSAPAQPH